MASGDDVREACELLRVAQPFRALAQLGFELDARGDVLGDAGDAVYLPRGIADGKPAIVDPAQRPVRAADAIAEFIAVRAVAAVYQVFLDDGVEPRLGMPVELFSRPSPDGLVTRIHVQHLGAVGAGEVEHLVD